MEQLVLGYCVSKCYSPDLCPSAVDCHTWLHWYTLPLCWQPCLSSVASSPVCTPAPQRACWFSCSELGSYSLSVLRTSVWCYSEVLWKWSVSNSPHVSCYRQGSWTPWRPGLWWSQIYYWTTWTNSSYGLSFFSSLLLSFYLFLLPFSPPHLFLSFLVSLSLSSLLFLPFPLLPLRTQVSLCSSDWPVEICSPSWLSFSETSRLARVWGLHHQDPKTCWNCEISVVFLLLNHLRDDLSSYVAYVGLIFGAVLLPLLLKFWN